MNPHHESDTAKPPRLADDLIWEISEIAAEIIEGGVIRLVRGELPAMRAALSSTEDAPDGRSPPVHVATQKDSHSAAT
jgi:hypothetical protein